MMHLESLMLEYPVFYENIEDHHLKVRNLNYIKLTNLKDIFQINLSLQ